jgi:ubiquinone/menaquinone biosynthesis C-methylase UbiE
MRDPDEIVKRNRNQELSERDDFTERRYTGLIRYFPVNAREVLDIGCNTGRGGAALKSWIPGLRISGMDCVSERLMRLDRRIYEHVFEGFADSIPLADCSIDAIIAAEIIEHIPPQSVFPSLCECFRILRLHGRLLITTPNPHYVKNSWQNKSVLLDASHVTQHSPSSLFRRLEDVGFRKIKFRGGGRVSRLVGSRFPLAVYGSYLAVAEKW